MSRVKALQQQQTPLPINWLNEAKLALSNCAQQQSLEAQQKIAFISEQLQLACSSVKHYSPNTIRNAYVLSATSSSAYSKLRELGILTLPGRTTLGKITAKIDSNMTVINDDYLKLRFVNLGPLEQHVVLSFDEIYIAKYANFFSDCICCY